MTPTSEQTVQKQSASAEERARDRALTLWRLNDGRGFFEICLQLCLEIESLRLTSQRLEAEAKEQRDRGDGLLAMLEDREKHIADRGNRIKELEAEAERMKLDIDFLARRASRAGYCDFTDAREEGESSNSIVNIAYELTSPTNQHLPADRSDLRACELMYKKLPEHRKTEIVERAMERAVEAIQIKRDLKSQKGKV